MSEPNELDIYKEALDLLSEQCCECPGTWFGAYDEDAELDIEAQELCECDKQIASLPTQFMDMVKIAGINGRWLRRRRSWRGNNGTD